MKGQIHLIEADLAGCESFHQDHGDWFYIEVMRMELRFTIYLTKMALFEDEYGS